MELTQKEIEKIRYMCFSNPAKSCAIVQEIIDTCQIVSCSEYSKAKEKSKRTVLYGSGKMIGFNLDGRRFVSFMQ